MSKLTLPSNPRFKQINCREEIGLDLRQSDAILKYRPDIVLLEYPCNIEPPDMPFNSYGPLEKPAQLVADRTKDFSEETLKKHPWVVADTYMWRNIAQLWAEGHQVLVYPTDGPNELTAEWWEVWNHMYPMATRNWIWWVQIYLRERLMANHINYIFEKHADLKRPMTMVYLERFHWIHVKFLLSNPSQQEIWYYYFGRFAHEVNRDDIGGRIEKLNPVFYAYWVKYSDFAG